MMMLLSFHLSLHVLFLFSLYTHVSYFLYAILYFYFTLRCLDEFCLKCFRNISCQNLSCDELSFCKVFQKFVLGLNFIVSTSEYELLIYDFSYISFVFCGFVMDCQMGRLLGHMWNML